MELAGWWRVMEADDTLRRLFPDPDLADEDWAPLAVPGHWQSAQPFTRADGPLLYRRRFESPVPQHVPGQGKGERLWLDLDGLFYQGDVCLFGSDPADTE